MSGWKEIQLKEAPFEIIDGDRGKNYPKQHEFLVNGYCLFLSAKNVTTSGFSFSETSFITEEKDKLLRKGKLKRYDVILTTRGTVGNVGYYNDKVPYEHIRINSGMVIIRTDTTQMISDYTFHLFKYLKREFDIFSSGSAQPQLPIRDLKEIIVLYPPLPEQKAIAGVLSSLDDKIDLLHRQNKTLEAMAETLFRQWFIEEVEDDWKQYQLKNFVEHVKINIKPQDKPLDAFSHFSIPAYDNGQDPIIELGKEIKSNKYLVVDNSILVSKLNPITPRVWCVFKQTFTNPICSTEFQVLKPNNANQFGFFYSLLKSNEVVNELAMAASGTSGSHQRVKASDILNISFSVPDVASISKFSEAVECNLKKIVMNKESMGRLVKIRDILLPKLMSGEVRVEY